MRPSDIRHAQHTHTYVRQTYWCQHICQRLTAHALWMTSNNVCLMRSQVPQLCAQLNVCRYIHTLCVLLLSKHIIIWKRFSSWKRNYELLQGHSAQHFGLSHWHVLLDFQGKTMCKKQLVIGVIFLK